MVLVEDSSVLLRRDVIVQVGLVCVEGCAVGSIYNRIYLQCMLLCNDELLCEVTCVIHVKHCNHYWL